MISSEIRKIEGAAALGVSPICNNSKYDAGVAMAFLMEFFVKARHLAVASLLLVSACNTYEPAVLDATFILEDATQAIERLNRTGALAPYAEEIESATHMAIFPNASRPQVSKFYEGRDGILLARDSDGTWRGPAFYRLHHQHYIYDKYFEYWDEYDAYDYGFPGRAVIMLFDAGSVFERMINAEKLTVQRDDYSGYEWDAETGMSSFQIGDNEVRVLIESPLNERWQHENYGLWDHTWMNSQTELDEAFFGERARPKFISRTETGYPSTHQYPAATRRLEAALAAVSQ